MTKLKHWSLLVLAIAVVIIALAALIEGTLGPRLGRVIERSLSNPGLGALSVVFGLLLVDVFLPVPSSLVMISSGALFGVTLGAGVAFAGSLAGNLLGFELARRYGAAAAKRLLRETDLDRMREMVSRHGALAILVSRPLPVIMETLSVVAGLGDMSRADFIGASILGTLPVCFVYAYAGARSLDIESLVPAIVAAIAVPAAAFLLWRRRIR